MLYPLLKNDTLFPGGLNGENLDLIFQNAHIDASRRAFRAMSESKAFGKNFDDHMNLYRRGENNWNRDARGFSVNRFGINRFNSKLKKLNFLICLRPDKSIEYESCASRRGGPVMFGRSSSFLDRTRYLPSTPKIRTEYPRFHSGFPFVKMHV